MSHPFPDESLGHAIEGVDAPRARDAFRSELRRALVATAQSEWAARPAARRAPRLSFASLGLTPRFALAAAVLVFAVIGAGGAAAASSLPGDPAYGLKVAYERVELALASDDAAKVQVLARQADRRLDELDEVSTSRPELAPTASAAYQETLAKFAAALAALNGTASDRDDAAVDVAAAAAEKHIAVLESIQARHDDTPGLDKALEQAKEIEREAKDKQQDERNRGRDRNETPRPSATPRSNRTDEPRGTPSPRATPKPGATFRIDDPNPGDD